MSWFNLWDGLKTKTCRYLLQRYLGQFFENNLNLEQLKVDLYNGKAVVENISLKVNALNELFEGQGWAFEVVSGQIGCLTAMVPWNALMTNDSLLNISNLTITLRPVTRCQSGTTMLESMWSSVSSSMQMAEECMKQIDDDIPFLNHNNTLIGLEKFAETIDNVLNRIHANLTNTTINIEYTLPKSDKKLIVSFKAKHVEYKNQTGYGKYSSSNERFGCNDDNTEQPPNLKYLPMIAKHNLVTNDLTIHTSELIYSESHIAELESVGSLCKIVEFKGCQNFEISVKQTENIVGPKINLEVIIDDIYFMLTPRQTHLLARILKGFDDVRPKDKMLKKFSDFKTELSYPHCNTKMTGIVEKDGEWCREGDGFKKSEFLYTDMKKIKISSSDISSTSTNSISTSYSNAQLNNGTIEKSGEILKFKMQIFKIVAVILHNDILFENATSSVETGSTYSNESFENYSKIANTFFPNTSMENPLKEHYIPIPNNNYLLIMVSSLLVNGNQQRRCNELTLKSTLSATTFDFSEILDNIESHLILFDRKNNCQEGYHTRPEITLSHNSSYLFKQNYNTCSNTIECTLDDCSTELDISIYDRLSALIGASPFIDVDAHEIVLENSNPMDVQIKCNSFKINLRFPVVDGRLFREPMMKNIRSDYLLFDFRNVLVQWKSYICVIVDKVDGYYCDEDIKNDIHIMQCSSQNKLDNSTADTEKIVVKVHSSKDNSKDEETRGFQNSAKQKCKSPFSSKCSYGYSSNIEGLYESTDKTEFFLPGDTDEINEFCEGSKDSSNLKILVSVPKVKIVLESKDLYEIIYNRLNWNLLMWEPESAASQEENSVCSFELCVKEGILLIYTDIRDLENKEQPSSRGKLQCNLKEFRLFSVTGLKNEKNLSYFCTQLKEIDVYHCGNILSDSASDWSDATDANLKRIICSFPNEQTVTNNRKEMLSVVAELRKQPDKRLKRMKLAFGINGVNVWHKPEYSVHHWIYELIDFLNVTDFPIEAYEPYALVSEIQGHIWNFAMEYRPKYLSYRALLDVGYCSFSSNIIYPITGCTLRMITEDCILSIGPTIQGAIVVEEPLAHMNCSGLVPVLSVGLINFSIHLNDQSKLYPNIDLRSSIHDMHLKTCFDAADALAQLIAYIANDKDLMSKEKNSVGSEKQDDCPIKQNDQNNDDTLKHINILMADAVKDVKETSPSDLPTKMNEKKKHETEIQQNTSLFKNSFDACNISDFESNVMLESCYQYEKTALPQVKADLGATLLTNAQVLEEKDFHVIDEEDIFFMDKFGVEQIYVSEDPLQIVDNHFCLPSEKSDVLRPPIHFPIPEQSYTLCEMTFTWHLFGGKDFPDLTSSPTKKEKSSFTTGNGMSETYKHGVSQAPRKKQTKLKKVASDELNTSRNTDVLVEIQFSKIRLSHDAYPKQSIYASRQVLVISDIEIRDRLLTSDINKLLYHSNKNSIPQRNDENMITVKALNVRSNVKKNRAEECSLKVSILPIRLNIDQDTLLFLEEFFSALVKGSTNVDNVDNAANKDDPMMAVNEISNALHNFKLNEKKELDSDEGSKTFEFAEDYSPNEIHPTYFKEFVFSPALPICFDYHGRRVELSRGPITGLVMGLAQLQGSGICLREVINRRGLLGWNKLFEFVCKEWLKDIKRNQLPNILSGIGPTNAVLQLFQGFFDLFRLPLQQYNKDGRIIRGFQLGAQSFSARTAFAALEITSRIIHLLQFTAETTFDMLSAGPSLSRRRNPKHGKRRQGRPKDLREGVANAYTIVKEGINESANTLLEAAFVEHDQKGYSGAVGAVVRQLPQLVVCPAVLATQATTNILGGAKSSLVPEAKREAADKWKNAKN